MPKYAHGKKNSRKKFLTGILIVVCLVALFLISFYVTKMITASNQAPMDMTKYEDASPEELREMLKEKDEEIKELKEEIERLKKSSSGSVSTPPTSSIPLTEPGSTPPKNQKPAATAPPASTETSAPPAESGEQPAQPEAPAPPAESGEQPAQPEQPVAPAETAEQPA